MRAGRELESPPVPAAVPQPGFRLRKPRPQVAQADPSCKPRIKKLCALAQKVEIDLWAMDEVHFQQHGSRCRMWVPPEVKDPVCYHAPTRKSISFGAVRLGDGKLVMSQPKGRFDAQTCWQFLRKLEGIARGAGRKGWSSPTTPVITMRVSKTGGDAVAEHFSLHFLPPYSPQLNPIERVWKLIRRCCCTIDIFMN